jgi:predicted dehydrogenase
LYRDGCHAIDLCRYLFGENQEVTKLKTKPIYDLSENDPTVSLHLKHELCDNIVMTAMDGNIASIFEFDILTNSGRYQFTNHGLQLSYWPIENNNAFGDYSALSPIPEISDTALNRALLELLQNAIEYLAGNSALRCVPKDGIMVHEIIRKVGKI